MNLPFTQSLTARLLKRIKLFLPILLLLVTVKTIAAPPAILTGGTTYPINGTSSSTSFATIQEAATFLAATGVTGTGNIILELQTGYNPASEPATGIFFDTIVNGAATRQVILRPAAGYSTTVTGSVAGAGMLNLRGTQYLTIEGRQGGSGAIGLTITNTSTATTDSSAAVKFFNGTSNVFLSYCNVKASCKSVTNGGVILISRASATVGNQVNIESCNIDGMASAHNGICLNGTVTTTTVENFNDTIRNCNIYDFFDNTGTSGTAGIRVQQGSASLTVTGNSIYQTASRAYTAQFLCFGINIGAGTYYTTDNFTITNNYIGGSGPLATGTMVHTAATVVAGYSAIFTSYGSNAVITGNTIKNISITGNSNAGTFTNPAIFSSVFYSTNITISNNTIDAFQVANTAGPVTTSGIHIATQLDTTFVKNITPTFTVTGNSIKNITAASLTTSNGQVYGIRIAPTSTTGQGGNLYYNNTTVIATQNIIDGMRTTSTSASTYCHGIWGNAINGGTSNHYIRLLPTITNNTIRNISSYGSIAVTGYPAAAGVVILNAHTGNATYVDTLKIRSNTIQDIYGYNTGNFSTAVGGVFTNLGRPDISNNKIFNIYSSANGSTNSPYVYGINTLNLAASSTADNNYISLGDTATLNQAAFGIMQSTSTASTISNRYNTILISGASTNRSSACIARNDNLLAGNATPITVMDNLLINRRTSTGDNAALLMPGTSAFTSNNNTFVTAATAKAGYYNTGALDFATWKSTTGNDTYSYYAQSAGSSNLTVDPATVALTDLFSSATYSSQANLQINNLHAASWLVNGKGRAIATLPTDFSGNARSIVDGIATDIGANEFTTAITPSNLVESGTFANGSTTNYNCFGRTVASVLWNNVGTVSSRSFKFYSGVNPTGLLTPNYSNAYWDLAVNGGASGYNCNISLNYDSSFLGTAPNTASTRVTDVTNGGIFSGTTVNNATMVATVPSLTSFTKLAITDAWQFIWAGITNAWNTASNWNFNAVPTTTASVSIPSGTPNAPLVTSPVTISDITIASGATLNNTATFTINGTLTNAGTVTNSGLFNMKGNVANNGTISGLNLNFNGTSTQTISGIGTFSNATINNAAGVAIAATSTTVTVTGTVTPTAGVLTTNGNLILKSDINGTARVATGSAAGSYITGNVLFQRYIPAGLRKNRFVGHPFATAMNLTELTDDIDITGAITGTNANGFTATSTSNPSAFAFTEANGDAATGTTNNTGWTAFTSDNSVSTILSGQGIRLLIRGTKGQAGSLTGGTYTPAAVTLGMNGALKQGDFVQNLSFTSAAKGWNLVSNPYASNVDWTNVTRTNVDNAVYTYRPALSGGNYGTYINGSAANGGSQYIESGSAFFVRANAATPTLGWHETDKASTNPTNSTFRTLSTIHNRLSLTLTSNATGNPDEVVIRFGDDNATDGFDAKYDAMNMAGAAHDLYVLDNAGTQYSIYHGSALKAALTENREVKLGMDNLAAGNYAITAKTMDAFIDGNRAYLKDAELNTLTEITDSTVYSFTVAAASNGINRFSIVLNAKGPIVLPALDMQFSVKVSPNPASDVLNINYQGLNDNQTSTIRIVNMEGKTIKIIELGKIKMGNKAIDVKGWSNGLYTVQLTNGDSVQSQNIIKQ